jgi:hypothetical protein
MRPRLTIQPAARDATLATVLLLAAIWAGSHGFADVDRALLGYLAATLVATFGTVLRASAFWRRPASAFFARALASGLRSTAGLGMTFATAGRDLAAQRFVARRSRVRWVAHLLLSLGTLAGSAISLPLVFGWMHFVAEGEGVYRVIVGGVPVGRLALDGVVAWLVFHALVLAAFAVVAGATYFLALRLRARRLRETATAFHLGPLLLLLTVALSGLALPATHAHPGLFALAVRAHEAAVVVLLLALPCSKLGHVLIRPLQLGARLVRSPEAPRVSCASCGGPFAPAVQRAAVERLLAARGLRFDRSLRECSRCRRRALAAAQAAVLGAHFQPPLAGARPAPARSRVEAA